MRFPLWLLTLISIFVHLIAGAGIYLFGEGFSTSDFSTGQTAHPTTLILLPEKDIPANQSPTTAKKIPRVKLPSLPTAENELPTPDSAPLSNLIHREVTPQVRNITPQLPIPQVAQDSGTSKARLALLPNLPNLHLNPKKSIVFLLDVSGSMYEDYGHTTRLIIAQQLLANLINSLPDGIPFAVVQYGQVAKISGPLHLASNETRQAAVSFLFSDFNLGGGTDLPAGFAMAMRDNPDRIVLATDGELNMLYSTLISKTSDLLTERKTVNLDIFGIYPRPNTEAELLLKKIAEVPHGHYFPADFDPSNFISSATGSTSPSP